ncbi:uncharacterized protein LOC105423891 [Pogonomyrmex barbatus]|uniref:Uncharacterized protein LOC105423891 n=1 Tax=Pogonomyrmex barbatus TaxID=144034 RepID=A0A6I9WK71_9HYME|nr:uncharacterized protein LOC105423891 [Pogonomyrmex barbatus]
MGISFVPLVVVAVIPIIIGSFGSVVGKRSITDNDIANVDYPDYSAKYNDYPVVPKRAALLFDQLLVALQKVVDNQEKGAVGSRGIGKSSVSHHFPGANSEIVPVVHDQTMDLQRRGQAKGEIFWRCYFNAVTCFKRK